MTDTEPTVKGSWPLVRLIDGVPHWHIEGTHPPQYARADGTQGAASKQGQTFAYYGPRPDVFARVFRTVGRIVRPEDAA